MKIGESIAKLRTEHKLTQEELGEKVGVSRQAVTKWESDESVPELSKLVALADIFEVSLDRLVGRDKTILDKFNESLREWSKSDLKRRDLEVNSFLIMKFIDISEKNGESAESIVQNIREAMEAEDD